MKSRLQIAGHPVHVMTVGIPIGLYTAAFVADALYVLVHDAFWYRMAFWCIALGSFLSWLFTTRPLQR